MAVKEGPDVPGKGDVGGRLRRVDAVVAEGVLPADDGREEEERVEDGDAEVADRIDPAAPFLGQQDSR